MEEWMMGGPAAIALLACLRLDGDTLEYKTQLSRVSRARHLRTRDVDFKQKLCSSWFKFDDEIGNFFGAGPDVCLQQGGGAVQEGEFAGDGRGDVEGDAEGSRHRGSIHHIDSGVAFGGPF